MYNPIPEKDKKGAKGSALFVSKPLKIEITIQVIKLNSDALKRVTAMRTGPNQAPSIITSWISP